jgi:hypothetical protein
MHVQDLVPYLKDNNHHDFGHVINKFQFEADNSGSTDDHGIEELTKSVKKRLEITNPLDGAVVHPEVCESIQSELKCELERPADKAAFGSISRLHVSM